MSKLMRTANTFSRLKNIRIGSNALDRCSFCEQLPREEKSINSIKLLGRVGGKPVQRGPPQHPVVTFSVATHDYPTRDPNGGWIEHVDWHQVIVFQPSLREFAQNYVSKGQRVLITGKLVYGKVIDLAGKTRIAPSVIADDIICL